MPVHFWIWLFFAIMTFFGGWGVFRTSPAPGWAWGTPVVVWLWAFAISWAAAGNPLNALVK